MRIKIFGVLLVACAVSAAAPAPAGAVVASTPSGRVGYLPLNGAAAAHAIAPLRAAAAGASKPHRKPPLLYHGGPVMHSHAAYAIFWVPSGYALPNGYRAGIEAYFQNVAADSGKPSNVYSVSAQYSDGTGRASYSDSFGGAVVDEHAYPTSGTCPNYKGVETFTACISDAKLEDQVEAVAAEQGWPTTGLNAGYYVVLPPHAGSCFTSAGTECFDKQYCAYHSFSEPLKLIYANISYSPGDPSGCGVGEYPNGHENGNLDDTLSSLSHEANESITDPLLNAWFDAEGFENGDECRNTADDYGLPLGGLETEHTLFNEEIGTADYYLQQEWSNDVEDCAQRVTPATPAISAPEEAAPGESVGFDGSGSVAGAGGIDSYAWDFGDGASATGQTPSHSYAATGEYTVTLTVEDDGGFTYSTEREVTIVANPQRQLTVSLSGSGTGTVSGSGIACPGTCSQKYPDGEAVTLTATPGSGSTFGGWSGAGCSGTDICEVTMSADQEVTAVFTAPLPPPSEKQAEEGGTETAGGGESAAVSTPTAASPLAKPAPRRCHKGLRRARRHGKAVCIKVKKHRKHH
jgi:hypothetical protein